LACRLSRILRLAVILSLRRKDEAMPKVLVTVENEVLKLTLPENWIGKNPLTEAELGQEASYQAAQGWQLVIE
jgi:exopolyphosphatase/guanosine-5'-triphosphate,3'-diphosphate pyrophosphatase